MPDPLLDVGDHLAGVSFKPMPIEVFGDPPELDNEVSGQVLGLGFAALFPPKPEQGRFVRTHDDPGVRAADEMFAVAWHGLSTHRISSNPFPIVKIK